MPLLQVDYKQYNTLSLSILTWFVRTSGFRYSLWWQSGPCQRPCLHLKSNTGFVVSGGGWDWPPYTKRNTRASYLLPPSLFFCTRLLRVTPAGTGVQLLTTRELRDMDRRCRLLWKVRTLYGGDMDQQIEQLATLVEFLLCGVAGCWKHPTKLCFHEFD